MGQDNTAHPGQSCLPMRARAIVVSDQMGAEIATGVVKHRMQMLRLVEQGRELDQQIIPGETVIDGAVEPLDGG